MTSPCETPRLGSLVAVEVGVVVAVAVVAADPHRVAAEAVLLELHRAGDDGVDRGAAGREHVDALVRATAGAGGAPCVGVGRAVDGADDAVARRRAEVGGGVAPRARAACGRRAVAGGRRRRSAATARRRRRRRPAAADGAACWAACWACNACWRRRGVGRGLLLGGDVGGLGRGALLALLLLALALLLGALGLQDLADPLVLEALAPRPPAGARPRPRPPRGAARSAPAGPPARPGWRRPPAGSPRVPCWAASKSSIAVGRRLGRDVDEHVGLQPVGRALVAGRAPGCPSNRWP